MGVDVDRLACPLHHPTTYNRQMRGHGLLLGIVLSHHCIGRWRLFGGVKPSGLDNWWNFDHVDACVTESYMD